MAKFAYDTYLLVPASNCELCAEEIKHVEDWANSNNLRLNHVKSMEIVFVSPRCVVIPASVPAVPTIFQELRKSRRLALMSVGNFRWCSTSIIFLYHVHNRCLHCALFDTMTCRQMLYSLFFRPQSSLSCHTHRLLGGDLPRLQIATVWKVFSCRRSTTLGFRPATAAVLGTIRSEIDDKLCTNITLISSSLSSSSTVMEHTLFIETACTRIHTFNSNNFT